MQLLSLPDFAPVLLLGTLLIILYLGQQLLKVMRRPEGVGEDSDTYKISSTAQALYELGKPATNLTPVLKVMREEVRTNGGEATQAGREFLARSLLQMNENTDAARFLELYTTYKTALNQSQRRRAV